MSYLAAPRECHYCGSMVILIETKKLLLLDEETSERVYLCSGCGARVGVHKDTKIPLGMLADGATRRARIAAHKAFDGLWMRGYFGRFKGYAWLAARLGIDHAICHIGWMDADLCEQVIEVCKRPPSSEEMVGLRSRRPWILKYKLSKPLGLDDMFKSDASHTLMQGNSGGKANLGAV